MNTSKCSKCGLVNLSTYQNCKRCEWDLSLTFQPEGGSGTKYDSGKSYFPLVSALVAIVVVTFVGYGFYRNMYATPPQSQQTQQTNFVGNQAVQINQQQVMQDLQKQFANQKFYDPKAEMDRIQRNMKPQLDKMAREN